MAQPADFLTKFVALWQDDSVGTLYFHVSHDAALANNQNPRALPMDPKNGQVLVNGVGPAAALAPAVHLSQNMAKKIFASFPDMPALQGAILGSAINLQKMRDLNITFQGAAGVDKTVVLAGNDFKITNVDPVNNKVTIRPIMSSMPLGGYLGLDKTVELLGVPALRIVNVEGREAPPPLANSTQTAPAGPTKVEVELTKNTFLSRSGDSSWTYNVYRGVTPEPTDKVAIKALAKAGLKQLPADTSYENYMVVLDLHFVPLAFARLSKDIESVVRGHNEAMKILCAKLLADERVAPAASTGSKDKKEDEKKAPHPVVHDMLRGLSTCVRTTCHLLGSSPESKEVDRLIDDQIELGHDILGRLLRRINYAVDHPSSENCRTPVWYYRQVTKKRGRDEKDE